MALRGLLRNQGGTGPDPSTAHDHRTRTCAEVVQAVMGMRRVELIVMRWSGLRAHNAVASFPSLALGSSAVQSLARLPLAVSAVVCSYPSREGDRLVAVVGAHAADAKQRDRAARELSVHGGRGLVVFDGDLPATGHEHRGAEANGVEGS